jgi:hypothetical protein
MSDFLSYYSLAMSRFKVLAVVTVAAEMDVNAESPQEAHLRFKDSVELALGQQADNGIVFKHIANF